MFLFIFESIGTPELVFIGIVALIFLGPRRMPEMARKLGKFMADLRSTTNDFKQTWEREVNFEEEAKLLRETDPDPFDFETEPRETAKESLAAPEIKPAEFDKERFESISKTAAAENGTRSGETHEQTAPETDPLSDKATWL